MIEYQYSFAHTLAHRLRSGLPNYGISVHNHGRGIDVRHRNSLVTVFVSRFEPSDNTASWISNEARRGKDQDPSHRFGVVMYGARCLSKSFYRHKRDIDFAVAISNLESGYPDVLSSIKEQFEFNKTFYPATPHRRYVNKPELS